MADDKRDRHREKELNENHRSSETIQAWLIAKLSEQLGISSEELDVREPFASYGLGSVEAVSLSGELEEWLGRRLPATLAYDYPTVAALARHLAEESGGVEATTAAAADKEPIAIIGMGCRFPGAKNTAAFWRLLRDGVDAVTEVPPERWNLPAFYDPDPAAPGKMSTRWGGFLERVDLFDPQFFGISPREAARMDPQQRLLLEVAWEALEDAGQVPAHLAGTRTGAFVGISSNDYGQLQFSDTSLSDAYAGTGNALSIAANRLSYFLNLRGPSIAVDTACSSSLVALHLACQSLRDGECALALVGGVNVILSPMITVNFTKAGFMAPDGRCKAFDARANGYVRGEGAGVVVLKPLSQALADGDPIHAVIRGSAVNQDGRSNGLTAPNGQAQEAVLREAYRRAGVAPGQIQYVEAHGTGTALGDPIEANALGAVLSTGRPSGRPCAIGSVKTNIGHLEAAAGIAALIKVVLALEHGEIPPSLHFKEPNPHIPFEDLPLHLQERLGPWPKTPGPALAGVSSFGFGGTNAHVVLEKPSLPPPMPAEASRPVHLITLSAKTHGALRDLTNALKLHLDGEPSLALGDIGYTANAGRSHFSHRLALVASSVADVSRKLECVARGEDAPGVLVGELAGGQAPPKIAFLFTGQGSQYVGMGRELYETQPLFRRTLNQCNEILSAWLEAPLLDVLYPKEDTLSLIDQTAYAQPALFALEYALAELWKSWGIEAAMLLGHSVGEYVAACIAGVMSLEDGLKLIANRGRLMQALPQGGAMAAVMASPARVRDATAAYGEAVSIAAFNGPEHVVLSGVTEAVREVCHGLERDGVKVQPLAVSHAFHSALMEPMMEAFREIAARVRYELPRIPLISTVSAERVSEEIATADYWVRHAREPVRFYQGMRALAAQGCEVFLELGPKPVLLGMGSQCVAGGQRAWLASLRSAGKDWQQLLESLVHLYVRGAAVDWKTYDRPYYHRKLSLPSYPFQRQRCWIETSEARSSRSTSRRSNGASTPIVQLLDAGDPEALAQTLELAEPMSLEEKRHLRRLLTILVNQHQKHLLGKANVVYDYYNALALLSGDSTDGPLEAPTAPFLTFGLLTEIIPGFSWIRAFSDPDEKEFRDRAIAGQQQLREFLFSSMDFSACRKVLDFGCGYGSDLVSLAERNPHLRLVGYTISREQARVATGTVRRLGLEDRLEILNRDSAKDEFSDIFDVVFGFEVAHHIKDKTPLFANIGTHLRDKGFLLLADFISNQPTAIEHEATSSYFITKPEWVEQLSANHLRLVHATAVSQEIANYLYDPEFDQTLEELYRQHPDDNIRAAFESYNQLGRLLRKGQADYVLLRAEKDEASTHDELLELNRSVLAELPCYSQVSPSQWFYGLEWRSLPDSDDGRAPEKLAGNWLVLETPGIGEGLVSRLREQGLDCIVFSVGFGAGRLGPGRYRIDPNHWEDFQDLVGEALAEAEAISGVVHLWNLLPELSESAERGDVLEAQKLGCGTAFQLAQTLTMLPGTAPRLWIVTRGAQKVGQVSGPVAVQQTPTWGLGRVITAEHPELACKLIDLDPCSTDADAVTCIWKELALQTREDQLAYRQGVKHVARLVRCKLEAQDPADATVEIRADSSYLVTGGLGALGMEVARWLVDQGACSVVLNARHGPSTTARKRIAQLEAAGARVTVVMGDVSQEEAVQALLRRIEETLPPLRGIIHAAGVLDDGALRQQNWERFEKVLAAKVQGSWHLHRLTAHLPLDLFVLFSSAAAVLGSPGQGNYAAANAFLDGLAHHRRFLGLAGLSINWGPWDQQGMAARSGEKLRAEMQQRGIRAIPPAQGLWSLGAALRGTAAQLGVLSVDWRRFGGQVKTRAWPLLDVLCQGQEPPDPSRLQESSELLAEFEQAPVDRRRRLLERYLGKRLARVLLMESAALELDRNLVEYGLDSIMTMELAHQLSSDLKVPVYPNEIFKRLTVKELAAYLEAEVTQTHRQGEGESVEPSGEAFPLVSVPRDQEIPLSFAQERLWFLDQLVPGSPVYNVPAAVRVTGPLKVRALGRCFKEIVRRHEVLRTTFSSIQGRPIQVTGDSADLTLPLVALQDLRDREREAEVRRLASAEAQRPFDLSRGPLLRIMLLGLGINESVCLLNVHHIVSDRWSVSVLVRELAALYEAFSHGRRSPLPELTIQYADFAVWQRQWLQGEVLTSQLSYWRDQLARAPSVLALPTDRPRPAVQTFAGAEKSFTIPRELAESIRALSRREGVTLFMTLLAAFQTLLYRYTGQVDILVGTPIANRNQLEIAALIGFFANTLALRTDLSGNPTFRELLGRVRGVVQGAYAHQDLPFERLVEEQPRRNISYPPLFQVMFVLEKVPLEVLELPGLTFSVSQQDPKTAKFDLTLSLTDIEPELPGSVEYNTDLFDEATITRLIGHFNTLVEGIGKDPNQRLSTLPLLTERERRQLLVEWNDTGTAGGSDACMHELVEAQVEESPEAVALVFEQRHLTYRELNRRANQLAHHLRTLGVGPEICVGICMDRSEDMVVGILAILKAGGACVPMDPTYPKERLALMLEDTDAPVLMTQQQLMGLLPQHEAEIICVDEGSEILTQQGDANPSNRTGTQHLAYVIYTSGSTGTPKGVPVSHRALANHCRGMEKTYGLNSEDRALQFASFNFDASLEQIFGTLAAGARLVLRDHELWTPTEFCKRAYDFELTVIDLPPGYWHELAQQWTHAREAAPKDLRLAIVGGDAMPLAGVRLWQDALPSTRLMNAYGPTEATITASLYEIPRRFCESLLENVPIGRPTINRTSYITDAGENSVPIGIQGELRLGGDCLARGYLNRPELTAERFVPNPYGSQPGERLYRTGDVVRYLPDGNIEFLGRTDHQVKVRGFRIELGEIEAVLRQHPAVRQGVVVAREMVAGGLRISESERQLVGYVVCAADSAPSVSELRDFLKRKLPEYMVPSVFVLLDELPLTAHGKVDRNALPEPEGGRPELAREFVAPRTPVEEALARIWQEVLGLEHVSVHDNFFELGGHSLLATQVVSRLRDAFDVDLPLRSLFESPTVAAIAEKIQLTCTKNLETLPLVPVPRDRDLPLSYAQQRLWFLDQLVPGSPVYNIPAAVRLTGPLKVAALERCFNEIVRRHEVLRTTFSSTDGRPIQVITASAVLKLPVAALQGLPDSEREAEVGRLARTEAERPFDLSRGPLLRVTLLRLRDDDHVCLFNMHHIVSDGWSIDVLVREFAALYDAFSNGMPSPLPELPIQYADFAVWQRQWLHTGVLDSQVSYWRKQLGGVPPVLKLPIDRPRPRVQSFRGAQRSWPFPRLLSDGIRALSRQEGATLFMTLLAAFQSLLRHYTGQGDILVGTPTSNRNRTELEGLIGFFINILGLRTDFSGDPSFREILDRVKRVTLDAQDHQDVPAEKLLEELRPERDISRTPLAQVGFAVQEPPQKILKIPGLTLSHIEIGPTTAKTDLSLFVWDESERLTAAIEYSTDLFEAATIERMLENFQLLLERIVADPERPISTLLPFLDANPSRSQQVESIYAHSNLTKNQLLIWLGQKLQPEVPLYNVATALRISGVVDPDHFQEAFQALVNSSDAFRTVIEETNGLPQQRDLNDPYTVEFVDFSQGSEPTAHAEAWMKERCQAPFDLEKRLFDCVLIKVSDNRYIWYLNQHHLVTDGWSVWLIHDRMAELYLRSVRGNSMETVGLPCFRDYVECERASRGSASYVAAENYWQQKLAEKPEPVIFYGRTAVKRTTRVQRRTYELGVERSRQLRAFARQDTSQASPFTILATVLCTYLYSISGNSRVSLGTMFHNRPAEFNDTIGLFMQILPLRLTIGTGETFLSLSGKVKAEMEQAVQHSQVAVSNPFQDRAYDVVLNYLNLSNQTNRGFNGLPLRFEDIHTGHGAESLALRAADFAASGRFTLEFDFNCALFDEEQQGQTMQQFLRALDAFLFNPHQSVRAVDLLSAEEKHRILVEFNQTATPFPQDQNVTQRFEAQFQKTPDRVAVVFEDRFITYSELSRTTNQLARYLQRLGVGPEVMVALYMERSLEMVVAILGILKAGGVYVPLDPAYPRERLAFILRDARARGLLTEERLIEQLETFQIHLGGDNGASSDISLIRLDADSEISRESKAGVPCDTLAQNLAYMIYTSGSIGLPKGAMVEHKGMLNHLYIKISELELTEEDVVAQTASQCFDISIWQFLAALLVGGRVHIYGDEVALNPLLLPAALELHGITIFETVPSLLRALLLETSRKARLWTLRWLIVTGEALPPDLCLEWLTHNPQVPLLNAYGPTECSDDVTHHPIERPLEENQPRVPIGHALANMQLYVTNRYFRPLPIGVAGELCVGGIGVGRGYQDNVEQTASVYAPDPFTGDPGGRLYKTGDLARYLPNGDIEFLGRMDHQVKIRGFRVELEEIEAVLAQHPEVREAVVTVVDDRPENAAQDVKTGGRLVGYIVPAEESGPDVSELRRFLQQKLPEYMVPSVFVMLDTLPLTPNGKVDRKALLPPDRTRPHLQRDFVAPRTTTEQKLAAIWSEVLGVAEIGIYDNFFELGGHSLLAVQVISRVRDAFKLELPLRHLFEATTVAGLAELIERVRWSAQEREGASRGVEEDREEGEV